MCVCVQCLHGSSGIQHEIMGSYLEHGGTHEALMVYEFWTHSSIVAAQFGSSQHDYLQVYWVKSMRTGIEARLCVVCLPLNVMNKRKKKKKDSYFGVWSWLPTLSRVWTTFWSWIWRRGVNPFNAVCSVTYALPLRSTRWKMASCIPSCQTSRSIQDACQHVAVCPCLCNVNIVGLIVTTFFLKTQIWHVVHISALTCQQI